ncbi:MAG TPA: O-methyltransferase [Vicinamibacterales bacterium]|nr:O-methyltransferase [Vicinamibacterales bacterium]
MSQDDDWRRVDAFLQSLQPPDPVLDAAYARAAAAGLPDIAVSPLQGRWLTVLARAIDARRILEIGTLGGYSSICLGRGLPADGRLITLEIDARHAEVARQNLDAAGLSAIVDVRVGPAMAALEAMTPAEPFDIVFIDADKTGYPAYLRRVRPLVRHGGLIVADNVVRKGAVADVAGGGADARAVREYLQIAGADSGLLTTVLQTVGAKGHDGFAISIVTQTVR